MAFQICRRDQLRLTRSVQVGDVYRVYWKLLFLQQIVTLHFNVALVYFTCIHQKTVQ